MIIYRVPSLHVGEDILLLKQKKVCYYTDIYKRNVIIT